MMVIHISYFKRKHFSKILLECIVSFSIDAIQPIIDRLIEYKIELFRQPVVAEYKNDETVSKKMNFLFKIQMVI